jgi:hypothetical protein
MIVKILSVLLCMLLNVLMAMLKEHVRHNYIEL